MFRIQTIVQGLYVSRTEEPFSLLFQQFLGSRSGFVGTRARGAEELSAPRKSPERSTKSLNTHSARPLLKKNVIFRSKHLYASKEAP